MTSALKLCLILTITASVHSARILGVFTIPSISHQVVFRALYSELVKRGHELVVITPDPLYRNQTAPKNLREIDIGDSYKLLLNIILDDKTINIQYRGVIMHFIDLVNMEPIPMMQLSEEIYNYKEVKDLIMDKNQKFDLVLFEGMSYSPLIFSEFFNAPAIMVSSFYGVPDNFHTIGATSHPLLYPHFRRHKFRGNNIFSKLMELYIEWQLYLYEIKTQRFQNEVLRSHFGDVPTISELKKHISMFFVNSHPLFDSNRPVPPGAFYMGALHLKPVKELPQDLKSYLDNSSRGVIYVSLGTNVRPSHMDKDFLDAFIKAFEALPYDVMWKFDGDNLEVPKNVRMQKWFPQRDLLGHPNLKLFVTQGGLQSTDEAIDAGVPLVGIPCIGDQWYNVNKYVELGIGVEVDALTLSAEDLVKAVNTVLSDDSYRQNIRKLRDIMRDQPEKPIDRAVWWTEYVIRHKGARHLLPAAAGLSWSEYFMFDVLATLAFILLCSVFIVTAVLRFIVRAIPLLKSKKLKSE